MFGMSLPEIIMIAVVAVIVLGPDKLPQTMVSIAKVLKNIKKSVNDAKVSFDQEIKIAELKEDAKKYKESIEKTTQNVRKKLTFEELDELKKGVTKDINTIQESIKNPTKTIKNTILNDKEEK
ncbi:twin arginine translocation system, TatB family protein [Campylobacter pinnipediorum subsp. caledonicus]|uniref:Sec-independent protein translocase protein TatB homolog n=1 Tax=Campylobacter pinnipediorum subsp. caledonicus TaxID=1874362 RepID=A0A1S6U8A1_9BACT|nr:Sec-independent protein translocase protein TatB [Campylobacter pinnipediorum]AQW84720.1 twin arginine translocation system, TatB family protein [Campylobacter pinnipediorum subsp. pinnipediorum]AQW86323.1 twin arginine translocation system, TatB family protein [Campylobacter pinnipediorum subsp. caledonicus]AQW87976.1 twin arginine translocation system, TatB family protein [Campylobacter pinnipediorum subsp. caledonicus]